jgi:hypothetical protein
MVHTGGYRKLCLFKKLSMDRGIHKASDMLQGSFEMDTAVELIKREKILNISIVPATISGYYKRQTKSLSNPNFWATSIQEFDSECSRSVLGVIATYYWVQVVTYSTDTRKLMHLHHLSPFLLMLGFYLNSRCNYAHAYKVFY